MRELFGKWKSPDPKFLAAVGLWRIYDRETDAFDLEHGAQKNDRGEVGPAHPDFRRESSRFAREAFQRLATAALALGIDAVELEEAKNSRERETP